MATVTKTNADSINDYNGGSNWRRYAPFSIYPDEDAYYKVDLKYYLAAQSVSKVTVNFTLTPKSSNSGSSLIKVALYNNWHQGGLVEEKSFYISNTNGGTITAIFQNIPSTVTGTVFVRIYQHNGPAGFQVEGTGGTFECVQIPLYVSIDKGTYWDINTDATISVTNRAGMEITYTIATLNSTTGRYVDFYSSTIAEDSIVVTALERWFILPNSETTIPYKVTVSDAAGRTAVRSGGTAYIRREAITAQVSQEQIAIDSTQTITITDPYNRDLSYAVYGYDTQNYRSYVLQQDNSYSTKNSLQITLPESSFVTAKCKNTPCLISVKLYDNTGRAGYVNYQLTRPMLEAMFIGYMDHSVQPPVKYAITGNDFQLQFIRRLDRYLNVFLYYGNSSTEIAFFGHLYQDIETLSCNRVWFDRANNITDKSMTVRCVVSDDMLREATIYFDVRAGNDMIPDVSCLVQKEQPSQWPQSLNDYFVQNYTKGKFLATVTAKTNSPITSVVMNSEQISTVILTYDSELEKYVGVTNRPLTSDTTCEITATDQRGMSKTLPLAQISVLPYSNPSVTIESYHRYQSEFEYSQQTESASWSIAHNLGKHPSVVVVDSNWKVIPCEITYTDNNNIVLSFDNAVAGTAYIGGLNDLGAYCLMNVRYVFSSLNNLNRKDTSVSVTGTGAPEDDDRTLADYTSTETYFFPAGTEHVYTIVATAIDLLNTESKSVILSTAGVIMDFLNGGKGIGLGKVAERQNAVEINPNWTLFLTNLVIAGSRFLGGNIIGFSNTILGTDGLLENNLLTVDTENDLADVNQNHLVSISRNDFAEWTNLPNAIATGNLSFTALRFVIKAAGTVFVVLLETAPFGGRLWFRYGTVSGSTITWTGTAWRFIRPTQES